MDRLAGLYDAQTKQLTCSAVAFAARLPPHPLVLASSVATHTSPKRLCRVGRSEEMHAEGFTWVAGSLRNRQATLCLHFLLLRSVVLLSFRFLTSLA